MSSVTPWGVVIGWLLFFVITGSITAVIASKKNRSAVGFFILGFVLPLLGIIVALIVSPGQPPAPRNMRSVVCPRCNARQNIDLQQSSYECWQCKSPQLVA